MKLKSSLPYTLIAAVLLLTGCATAGRDKTVPTSSLETAARDSHAGNRDIDAVLFALVGIVNNHDDVGIAREIAKLDLAAARLALMANQVNTRTAAMEEQGTVYFDNWDRELAKIRNEDIAGRSAARKNDVAIHFANLRAGYVETTASFTPFMADLSDIRTTLFTNPTPGGINVIKPVFYRLLGRVVPLTDSLAGLEDDFLSLGINTSTATKTK